MSSGNILMKSLAGESVFPPPIWLMRQAGRHLPEYMELRRRAGDFLALCNNPALAVEVTLQPVRRYDMDAAIIFSDILLLLKALGCEVNFEKGAGPKIRPIDDMHVFDNMDMAELDPTLEAIAATRNRLDATKTLIGFAGAPFTLAVYALAGGNDQQKAVRRIYRDEQACSALLERLAEAVVLNLAEQARAGADVLMLFDSWAGGLSPELFRRAVIEPNRLVRSRLRELQIDTPVIGFPRGAGTMLEQYAANTGMDCIGLDTSVNLQWAGDVIPARLPAQGNLDPLLLLCGGEAMEEAIAGILQFCRSRPFIFNLGHGVHPETPIAHVERLIELVRGQAI